MILDARDDAVDWSAPICSVPPTSRELDIAALAFSTSESICCAVVYTVAAARFGIIAVGARRAIPQQQR
jgi:hypothetical protein